MAANKVRPTYDVRLAVFTHDGIDSGYAAASPHAEHAKAIIHDCHRCRAIDGHRVGVQSTRAARKSPKIDTRRAILLMRRRDEGCVR